jgi:hypothetical protein
MPGTAWRARARISAASSCSSAVLRRMRAWNPASSSGSPRLRFNSANHGSAAWSSKRAGFGGCCAPDQVRSSSCTRRLIACAALNSFFSRDSDTMSVRRCWKKNWQRIPQ